MRTQAACLTQSEAVPIGALSVVSARETRGSYLQSADVTRCLLPTQGGYGGGGGASVGTIVDNVTGDKVC